MTSPRLPRLIRISRCSRFPDGPAHQTRKIRDNLLAPNAEEDHEGWTGEAEGLKVSLATANIKIAQADLTAARRAEAVRLGIPAYRDIAAATPTTQGAHGH